MRTHLLFLAALGAVLATPLQAQWLSLYGKNGTESGSSFGYSMARLADRDNDGFPELLVGAIGEDANGLNSGAVHVLNGEDGSLIMTVPGEGAGSLFGASLAPLSDLNGDLVQDFAVSAPYHTGLNGFFSGRVYVVSGADGSFLDILDGLGDGNLFGSAIAGTDVDGDGVAELAIGSIGANGGDGEVRFYEWSAGIMTLMSGGTLAGAAGSKEWFGFSMEDLGDLVATAGHEMVIGAPYANDGGALSGSVTAVTNLTPLRHYYPNVAGAQAGFSVSAIMGATGGYVVGGAPGTANGSVFVWNGATTAELMQLDGAAAGDHFGYAVQLIEDRDFDGLVELVVGAPDAAGAGKGYVLDIFEGANPTTLLEVTGTAGSRLGAALVETGDVNATTISDLAFAAPDGDAGLGRRQGHYQVWTPPDSNIGPLTLTMTNTPVLDSQVDIQVDSIKENANLYCYIGTTQSPTTTAEGFQIDIGGLMGGSGGNDYFELASGVTGGSYSTGYQLPITLPPGQAIFLQVVEQRGVFDRISNVDGGVIQDRSIELDISAPLQVNWTSTLETKYAHRDTAAVVYYFLGLNQGSATYLGSINTGLSNPYSYIDFTSPDQYGNASKPWLVPSTINGHALSGRTVLLSTVSYHGGDQRLGYYGPTTIL